MRARLFRTLISALLLTLLMPLSPWGAGPARAAGERTVTLPITLDYPWLRSMLVYQIFNYEGQRSLLTGADGCSRVELSEPRVYPAGDQLGVEVRIKVEAGVRLFGQCVQPVQWEGYLQVHQMIWVEPATWQVRVKTLSSEVFNLQHEPAVVADIIWKLIRGDVYKHLDRFSVDLRPPLDRTREQIPMLFPSGRQAEVERWLDSLRLGGLQVGPNAVTVALLMEVTLAQAAPAPVPAPPDEAGRERLLEYWRSWDALLVHQLLGLQGDPLTPPERDELLSVLVETRHGLLAALGGDTLQRDLVRQQFVWAWSRLAPILRRHLGDQPSPSLLHYLSYFSAADALAALDQLGPTLGLDISREGLLRLAWLVDQGKAADPLAYSWEVKPELRKLLALGPEPAQSRDAEPVKLKKWEGIGSWLDWLVGTAWAAEWERPLRSQLEKWLPPKDDPAPYQKLVLAVMARARDEALEKGGLPPERHALFRLLLPATVWQESCWRQFVVEGDNIKPLRSYNNSSVGILQVNDLVWRGMYDRRSLNWDLAYNAAAGCEILENYLRRYALERSKTARRLDDEALAQAVYAMYNGGPGQLWPFLERLRAGRLLKSDRLFLAKYRKVKKGTSLGLDQCLAPGR